MRDETRYEDARSFEFPQGVVELEDLSFGLQLAVPKRFVLLPTTFDPAARNLRHLGGVSPEDELGMRNRWPQGFYDPAVYRIYRGAFFPMRTLEFQACLFRPPRTQHEEAGLWRQARRGVPERLEELDLPGCRLLDVRDATVNGAEAVWFEYLWDGPGPRVSGGDHALLLFVSTPGRVALLFHHCPGDYWDDWKDELDDILASFTLTEFEGCEHGATP